MFSVYPFLLWSYALLAVGVQLLLCLYAKRTFVKWLPIAIFTVTAVILYVISIKRSWELFIIAFLILSFAVLCGVVLGAWVVVRKASKSQRDFTLDKKKKALLTCGLILVTVTVTVLSLTGGFTRSAISGKLYRVDSVFEEIQNLLASEERGQSTVLTTAVEGAERHYEFGMFEGVRIPLKNHSVYLSFEGNKRLLSIRLTPYYHPHSFVVYLYDYRSNMLYGNGKDSLLMDVFVSNYVYWRGENGKFSADHVGDYTYEYAKYPLSYELIR